MSSCSFEMAFSPGRRSCAKPSSSISPDPITSPYHCSSINTKSSARASMPPCGEHAEDDGCGSSDHQEKRLIIFNGTAGRSGTESLPSAAAVELRSRCFSIINTGLSLWMREINGRRGEETVPLSLRPGDLRDEGGTAA